MKFTERELYVLWLIVSDYVALSGGDKETAALLFKLKDVEYRPAVRLDQK